jgi:uncharacterized membrane protein
MNKIRRLWIKLRTTFWFVPSLIVAVSILLAVAVIEVDSSGSEGWLARWPRIFGAGAGGARGMLSTIAGSTMTVVGVTFSMTLVTLALASSQYTSRILRNFTGDRVTQVVLGMFTGIFTYCLIVLRTIRGGDEGVFVPSLAVTFAVVLAISGIVTLIFFIHHIASSIQASSIIASVAAETMAAVDRLFPEKLGEGPADDAGDQAPPTLLERKWQAVPVKGNGYIQSLDDATLLRVAREQKTIVRMERGVGEFVVQDTPLVSLAQDDPPGDDMIAELQNAYGIDRYRTVDQDSGFGIRQLVDIALKSLSPGINDTTTAVMCVDYLTAILSRLATRDIPSSHRYEDGELRVIAIGPTFASLVGEAFDQIRSSAEGNLSILLRMLGALQTIGSLTDDPRRRRILGEQMNYIAEMGAQSTLSGHDRARFDERLSEVGVSIGVELVPAPHEEPR